MFLQKVNICADDLRDFFEEKYGPVLDAVVIGSQSGDHMQSRGFGFVTFKYADSVAAAVEAHYINIYGKKVTDNVLFGEHQLIKLVGPGGEPSVCPTHSLLFQSL